MGRAGVDAQTQGLSRLASVVDRVGTLAVLAVLLAGTFALRLKGVGHTALGIDESCHAIVARSLLDDPFRPMLYREDSVFADRLSWIHGTVWLHKPILPLWTIAASYAALGVDTFALRFPSVVLATACVLITYFIGRELFGRRAGLVAAAIQAVDPCLQTLVDGRVFSDHVDVSLLFWTEVSILFLLRAWRTGRTRDAAIAGAAAGAAYLSKYFLGFLSPGLALVLWFATRRGLRRDGAAGFCGRQLGVMAGGAVAVAGPWVSSCLVRFRELFVHEHVYALAHIAEAKEKWDAPWDRLVFDYAPFVLGFAYTAVACAALVGTVRMWKNRVPELGFTLLWGVAVLVPHLVATTKTPTATLIAAPAAFVLVGWLVVRAIEGDELAVAANLGFGLASFLVRQPHPVIRRGAPEAGGFCAVLAEQPWIWKQWAVAAVAGVGILAAARIRRRLRLGDGARRVALVAMGLGVLGSLGWIGWRDLRDSRQVGRYREDTPDFRATGLWLADHVPDDAVVLFDSTAAGEQLKATFWSGRECRALRGIPMAKAVSRIRAAGRKAYLVSARPQGFPELFRAEGDGRAVFEIPETATFPSRK